MTPQLKNKCDDLINEYKKLNSIRIEIELGVTPGIQRGLSILDNGQIIKQSKGYEAMANWESASMKLMYLKNKINRLRNSDAKAYVTHAISTLDSKK